MLTHLDQLTDREHTTGVCIVGGGPAGITLARGLAGQGIDVVLCEGGGLAYDDASQVLYSGDVLGDEYHDLDITRLRFLGGSSNHWNGVCADLADFDFEAKPAASSTG